MSAVFRVLFSLRILRFIVHHHFRPCLMRGRTSDFPFKSACNLLHSRRVPCLFIISRLFMPNHGRVDGCNWDLPQSYTSTRGPGKLCLSWWIYEEILTFFQHCQTEHFLSNSVRIEKLLFKKNHFDTKLWTTIRSPRKARLNQGTLYSQGNVSSFQGRCLLSCLNGWCGSYLWTTKGCRTQYLKSSGLYI